MSDTLELSIDTRDLEAALAALPKKLRGPVVAKALQLAGDVMLGAVVAHTPYRTDEPTPDGDSLAPGIMQADMHTEVQIAGNSWPRVKVGPTKVAGHVARWVNGGFNLTTHGSKSGRRVIRAIPGKHFLEAAFDETADKAIGVMLDSLFDDLFDDENAGPEGNSHDVDFD